MNKIYLAQNAHRRLIEYLSAKGYVLEFISSRGLVDPAISCHPDVFMCKMGLSSDVAFCFAQEGELEKGYPAEAAFNAVCTGRYFIHNLNITNSRLLTMARDMGMECIHVPQGYTKCSTVIADERSIITYDRGIAKACSELDVLLISSGHVILPGYDTGFIGGCSGRIGNELIFNGDLSVHPDFDRIRSFIHDRGLKCVWFPEYPLTDIGSIL